MTTTYIFVQAPPKSIEIKTTGRNKNPWTKDKKTFKKSNEKIKDDVAANISSSNRKQIQDKIPTIGKLSPML
jgi:hypothetical protein